MNDTELPGMWEFADFEGGETDEGEYGLFQFGGSMPALPGAFNQYQRIPVKGNHTMSYPTLSYTGKLQDMAHAIVRGLRGAGFTHEAQPDRQALALGEEVGEFIGTYRRWRGMARRTDTVEHVVEELADVVITAFVTADEYGWDLDGAIARKAHVIMTRGWRDETSQAVQAKAE